MLSLPRARVRSPLYILGVAFCTLAIYLLFNIGPFVAKAASTSSYLNFQARLLTNTGAVVADGFYDVQFNLYNVSSGGSTLWTETRDYNSNSPDNRVRVVNGYLTVNLGSVNAFGAINWDQDLWLGMTVRGTNTCSFASCTPADSEMTPRIKVTAVPYAFRAGTLAVTSGSNVGTLTFGSLTASRTITLPDENGTVCLQSAASCGFESTGGNDFIKNQNSSQQTANFWISGNGRIDGSLLTSTIDTATATALGIGAANATAVNIAKSGILTTVNGALNIAQNLTANGDSLFKGTTESTTAFRIQNSISTNLLLADTSNFQLTVANLNSTGPITVSNDRAGVSLRAVLSSGQVTVSGNEITDSSRSTATQGDGRSPPDSSYGIWESSTNLLKNGGVESNTNGWTSSGTGVTISQSTAQAKFGSASLKWTTNGGSNDAAGYTTSTNDYSAGDTITASVWVKADTAITLDQQINEADSSGTFLRLTNGSAVSLSPGVWTRLTTTLTLGTSTARVTSYVTTNGVQPATTLYVDGSQVEKRVTATPYIETNGSTGSRSAGRVQATASSLNGTQGWFAARIRPSWASSGTIPNGAPGIFEYTQDANNRIIIYFNSVNSIQVFRIGGGSGGGQANKTSLSFNAGDLLTVVGYWKSNQLGISVNGSTFTTASQSTIPSPVPSTFDIGSLTKNSVNDLFDGDVLWAAAGTGTLSDSDASNINKFGNSDPTLVNLNSAAASSTPTFVWHANTPDYAGTDAPAVAKSTLALDDVNIFRSAAGSLTIQGGVNSTTAFQIQNASGSSLFTVDTTNTRIAINATPANGLLTVGTNTTTASGGIYFGTDTDLYRSGTSTLQTDSNFFIKDTATTAFQVQQANGTTIFNINTSTGLVSQTPFGGTYLGGADINGSTNTGGVGTSNFNSEATQGRYLYEIAAGSANTCSQSAGSADGCELQVYDISTPGSPKYIGGADASGSTNSGSGSDSPSGIAVAGHFAYVVKAGNDTACSQTAGSAIGCELQVYDISNPSAPTYVGGSDSTGKTNSGTGDGTAADSNFNNIYVSGRYAYVIKTGVNTACSQTVGSAIGCELQVYDISNPANPLYLGGGDVNGGTNSGTSSTGAPLSIYVQGRYAYIAKTGQATACVGTASNSVGCEFQIWDISNPAAPSIAGGIDITGSNSPGTTSSTANSIYVSGRYAYIAKANNGTVCTNTAGSAVGCELQIYDVSNPASPTYVGGGDAGGNSGATSDGAVSSAFNAVAIGGRYAYIAKANSGTTCSQTPGASTGAVGCELQVYDISNPASISYLGGADSSGTTNTGNNNESMTDVVLSGRNVLVIKAANATACSSAVGCELQAYDISGIEATSIVANSLTAGTLLVQDSAVINNQLTVGGSLVVGQSANIQGNLGVGGYALFRNQTDSNTSFQIQTSNGSSVLSVDTINEQISVTNLQASGVLSVSNNGASAQLRASLVTNNVTVSGNEITDATRTANTQGDGRNPPDSSYGIWGAGTNYLPNTGGENSGVITGWSAAGTMTVTQDTTRAKFGSGSYKIVATGTTNGSGIQPQSASFRPTTSSTGNGGNPDVWTASAWVWAPSGSAMRMITDGITTGGSATSDTHTTTFTGNGAWQRVTSNLTINDSTTATFRTRVLTFFSQSAGFTFWVDGLQAEKDSYGYATPYIENNSTTAGSTYCRSGATCPGTGARVQASASSYMNSTTGWVAARVRMGYSSTAVASGTEKIFDWNCGTDGTNCMSGYYDFSDQKWKMVNKYNTGSPVTDTASSTADSFSAGDYRTVIFKWSSSNVYVSVNGGAFVSASRTGVPTMADTTFEIGGQNGSSMFNGDVLWAATGNTVSGSGVITDSDANALYHFGNTDPNVQDISNINSDASPAFAWKADTGRFQDTNPAYRATLVLDDVSLFRNGAGGLTVQGAVNSTTAFQVQNASGTSIFTVDTQGSTLTLNGDTTVSSGKNLTVTAGSTTLTGATGGSTTALTVNTGAASNVGALIKGAASQTADLFQIQDSTSANIYRLDASADQETIGYYNNSWGGIGPYGNLLKQSEAFDQGSGNPWTYTGVSPNPPTANTILAPDGNTTAEAITATAGGPGTVSQTYSSAGNNTYTLSVWLKAASGTQNVDLRIDSNGTPATGTTKTVTTHTTWERFFVTQTFSSGVSTITPKITISAGQTFHIWGAQLIQASVPEAYVRTTASTVAASGGVVSNGGVFVSSLNASDVPLVIQGAPSQASNLVAVQDSTGASLFTVSSSGLVTAADDLAVNGGDITTSGTGTVALFNTNAASTLNIGGSTSTINVGGGSSSTGCTIDSSGNLVCTGNISGGGTGTEGFWSRSGTTLQPATAGDNVTTTSGGTITSAGLLTGQAGLTVTGGAIALNNASSSAAIGLGNNASYSGTITIGAGSAVLQIDSTAFDVSTGGALSGISTIVLSGSISGGTTYSGSGNITTTGGDFLASSTHGLDTSAAGTLALGNSNATTVSICNSANCDTIQIGTNTDADTITLGDSTDTVGINGATTILGTTLINTTGSAATSIGNITGLTTLTGNVSSTISFSTNFNVNGSGVTTSGTAFKSPAFRANADSATGIQLQNAAGSTTVLDVDTTNNRIGIGTTAPAETLTVVGDTGISTGRFNTAFGGFGQYSNLLHYSEQFDQSAAGNWAAGAGASVTGNTTVSPDGQTSADTITFTTTSANNFIHQIYDTGSALGTSRTFTFSFWAKAAGGDITAARAVVRDSPNTESSGNLNFTLTSNWERYTFTKTFSTSTNTTIDVYIQNNGVTGSFRIWGGQLEEASTAGVYVSTTTNRVTTVSRGLVVNANQALFTNSVDSTIAFAVQNAAGTNILIADTTDQRVGIGTSGTPSATLSVGGTTGNFTVTSAGLVTTADDIAVNGGDLTTTATGTVALFNTNAATTLNIGGSTTTVNVAGGSGSTGCSIDGSGNLVCTGSITSGGGSTVGYWNRSGTTLSPATSGDNISTTGSVFGNSFDRSTSGTLSIGTTNATTINIGNGNSGTAVTIDCGQAGGTSCSFGATANDHGTTIGSTTGNSLTTIQSGASGISLSGNTTVASGKSFSVAGGNSTFTGLSSGTGTAATINTNNVNNVGLLVKGAASQVSDLFQLQDSTSANIYRIDASGNQETIGYYNNSWGGIGPYANLLTFSEQFNNAAWNRNSVNSPLADTVVAPDGNTTAESLADSASGGSVAQSSSTAASNNNFTFSVWLKTASSTQAVDLRIDGSSGGTGTKVTVTATTTWQRFSVTQNANGLSGNVKVLIFPGGTGGSGTVHAWGAQLIQASVPEAYVRTTASTVAASSGVVSNGGVFVSAINSNDVPLVIQGAPSQSANLLALQDSTGANLFTVSSAGAVVAVGVNSGSGLIQGTGGLTVTGTVSVNATGSSNTTIGGTGGGTITIGGASGSDLVLQDAQWGVTGLGAATVTSLNAGSGTIQTTGSVFGNTIDRSAAGTLTFGGNATTISVAANNFIIAGGDRQILQIGSPTFNTSASDTILVLGESSHTPNTPSVGIGIYASGSSGNDTLNISNSNGISFTKAGTATIDAASGQNLNLGTSASNHTTTLGSTNGTATTTIQSGSGGINLNGATTVGSGNSFSVAGGNSTFTGLSSGTGTAATINTNNVNNVGLLVKGAASQVADLFQIQDSTAANLFKVDSIGNIEQLGFFDTPFGGLGQYSNLLLRSEDLATTWSPSNITVTANDGASNPAPDGNTTADKLVSSATNATLLQTYGSATNTTYNFSMWVKTNSGTQPIQLKINSNGTPAIGTAANFTATTTWQRFNVSQTFTSGVTSVSAVLVIVNNSATVVGWGGQLVQGSSPGVYVRTVGSTVAASDGLINNGNAIFIDSANSTTAYQFQNASGNPVLSVDTSNGKVILGTSSSVAGQLVFKNASNSNTITITSGTLGSVAYTLDDLGGLGGSATICSNSALSTCLTPGAGYVFFSPNGSTQTDGTTGNSIGINKTGASGNILELQKNSSDVFLVDNAGAVTIANNLAVNGGNITTSSTGTVALFNTNAATALNIGGSTTTVNVAGGSGSTGCSIDGSGNLVCTGSITSGGGSSVGYWNRSGTTLSPATSGDNVTTSGNISTSGSGTITSAGLLTGSAGLTVTGATSLTGSSAGSVVLIAKGAASQTADLFELQDSTSANLYRVDASGNSEQLGYIDSPFGGFGAYGNMVKQSEAFDQSGGSPWAYTNVTVPTANTIVAPDGNTTAESLATSSSGGNVSQNDSGATNTTYTFSVWLKAASSTQSVDLRIDSNGTPATGTANRITATTTWQRFSVSQTFTSGVTTITPRIFPGTTGGSGTIHAWGAQIVQASTPGVYVRTGANANTASTGFATGPLTIDTTGSLNTSGSLTAVGVNAGSGLLQGTGGLTITGTTSINTTGSATTTIGALTNTNLILQDADWNITGGGAATFSDTLTINQAANRTALTIANTNGSPSTAVVDISRTNNVTASVTNALLHLKDHHSDYLIGAEGTTAGVPTTVMILTGDGQLQLPVSGSSAGIVLGGDASIYRSAANTITVPGTLTSSAGLTLQAAGTNTLTLNTAGAGIVNLGTSNSTTIGIGNASAAVTLTGSNSSSITLGTNFTVNSSGALTTASTINTDTLGASTLTFSGATPVISASTTNTGLTLQANGSGTLSLNTATTGAVNIGNSTGAITLNGSTSVASGKNLTVTAGSTSLTGVSGGSSTAVTVATGADSNIGLLIKGNSSTQTADLLQIQDSTSTNLFKVDSTGDLEVSSGYFNTAYGGFGQYSNFLQQSEQMNTSPWAPAAGATVTQNQVNGPDGTTNTADQINFTTTSSNNTDTQTYNLGSSVANLTYTFSVWVKSGTTSNLRLDIRSTPTTADNNTFNFTATTNWQRYSITYTFPGADTDTQIQVLLRNWTNTGTLYFWGAQLNLGSGPGVYVRTLGSTVASSDGLINNGTALFIDSSDSTTAYQFQNAAGTNVMNIDTTDQRVGIGTSGTPGQLLSVGGTTGNFTVSTTGAVSTSGGITLTAGALAINTASGITSSQSTLILNAGGTFDVQDTLNADNITTDTGGVSIAAGQSYTGAGAVTLSSSLASALTITGNGSSVWSTVGAASTLIVRAGANTANTALLLDTNAISGGTGGATLTTGNASSGISGATNINTGTGTTATGNIVLLTGNASAGTAGNISIDVGTSTSGNGTISLGTASRAQTLNLGNSSSGTTISLTSGGTSSNISLTTNGSSAGVIVKSGTNSATAFQVQNSSNAAAFTVDTVNALIKIGSGNDVSFAATGNASATIRKSMVVTSTVNANDLVIIDAANAGQVTTTTTANSTRVFGIATATQGSTGQTEDIVTFGVYQVNVDTAAVSIGDFLVSSITTGRATVNNSPPVGTVIGRALSSKGAGSNGTVWVQVNPGVGGQATGSTATLQNAYDNSTTPATVTLADGKNLVFAAADTTTDPAILFQLQCVVGSTCAGDGGRFALQDTNGADVIAIDSTGRLEALGYFNNSWGGFGAYSNLIQRSEAFDNAQWVKTNVTTPTADTVVSPDNNTTAESLADSSSGGKVTNNSATAPTNANYTFSVWLKTSSGTQSVDLQINGATTGAGTIKTVTATPTWQRFWVTQNPNGFTGNIQAAIYPGGSGGSGTVSAWGAQLVLGSTPGVYIRTTNAAVAANSGLVINAAVNSTALNVNGLTSGTALSAAGITSGNVITATAVTTGKIINGGNTLTTGTGITIGLGATATTASVLSVTSSTAATSAYTGSIINIAPTRTVTAASTVLTESGSMLSLAPTYSVTGVATGISYTVSGDMANFNRTITNSNSGATLNVSGSVLNLQSNVTSCTGTCSDTGKILNINQQDSSSTGDVISVSGAGTGNLLTMDATNSSANGSSIDVQSSSSSQFALKVTSNNGSTNILYARADGRLGIGTTTPGATLDVSGSLNQASGAVTLGANATSSFTTSSGNLSFDAASTLNVGTTNATSIVIGGNTSATITEKIANSSTTAFQLQTAGATAYITVDTTNTKVQIGSSSTDSTAISLILDSYNGSSDPSGTAGAMYYNTSMNKFRCYENGVWYDCIGLSDDRQRLRPFYNTDFFNNSTQTNGPWTGAVVGTGGSTNVPSAGTAVAANHEGLVRLAGGTGANAGYRYESDITEILLAGGETYELVFNPIGTTNETVRMGFLDANSSTDATDGAYLELVGTTLTGKTANNSTRSSTGTTATLSASTWYRAKIVVNSNATRVDYYLYNDSGTQLWTDNLTTNIPTASGRETGTGVVATDSGTSSADILYLDYLSTWWDRTFTR